MLLVVQGNNIKIQMHDECRRHSPREKQMLGLQCHSSSELILFVYTLGFAGESCLRHSSCI